MVSARAARGNSKEVTPVGAVTRHTAVPDFVSGPNFSHTNKYLPPAVDCVRSTRMLVRLHSTFVASNPRPLSNTMTSCVIPNHQFGGSTFVTSGELSSSPLFADAVAGHTAKQIRIENAR